jgi:LPS sulfotransferase NodH
MVREYTGYLREIYTYSSYPFRPKNTPHTKFLIFSIGRTGGNLLASLLNSHSKINCRDELLLKPVFLPVEYLKMNESLSAEDVYGFKLNTFHFRVQKINDPVKFVQNLVEQGYQIVHLQRRNFLRLAISHLYAVHRKKFHHKSNQGLQSQIRMSVGIPELEDELELLEGYRVIEDSVMENVNSLSLYYEDDLLNENCHQSTVDRIAEYLEIPPDIVKTDYIKTTPADLSSFIENYDELKRYLSSTRYSKYIKDL